MTQPDFQRHDPQDDGGSCSTVVIVEDHAMVAQGLSAALADEVDMEVIGVVSTAHEAMEMLGRVAPDVALVDFRLPDGDGAELAAMLTMRRPETHIVMLTAADDHEVLTQAIEAGAAGFLHKSEPIQEVVRAIRAVVGGERWFRPEALADVVRTIRGRVPAVGHDLTAREREVLALLAEGLSTQEMIETLVLSPHTVRNHVRNVMTKLGSHSKLEAVATAARAGIVSVGRAAVTRDGTAVNPGT
ncbi:MAG: response regulator transcription factor [Actinomycetota bacterium]|nr:response regulator transcription factor [Actinomycetota bacterium]